MYRAWYRCCQTDADFIGKFGMGRSHKRGHLFMAYLNKFKQLMIALKTSKDAINAIARIAINTLDAPGGESSQQKITHLHSHILLILFFYLSVEKPIKRLVSLSYTGRLYFMCRRCKRCAVCLFPSTMMFALVQNQISAPLL